MKIKMKWCIWQPLLIDDGIKNLLKEIEDETDDPDKGKKPPIISLLLLLSLIQKRWGEKK